MSKHRNPIRPTAPQGLLRKSGRVLIGSVGGFAIALAVTPLFTRIYSPDQFGRFATVLACASALIGLSTMRSEIIAQKQGSDAASRGLIRFGLTSSIFVAVLVTAVAMVATLCFGTDWEWSILGTLIAFGSLQFVGAACCTIEQRYNQLSFQNFVQQAGTPLSQTLLGLAGPSFLGLALGFSIARIAWLGPVARTLKGGRYDGIQRVWRDHRRYLVPAGSSAFINNLSSQLLILVGAALYGAIQGGIIAMAVRVLVGPMLLICQAVAAATIGEFGQALRDGTAGDLLARLRRTVVVLFSIALIPLAGVAAFGPRVIGLILGNSWADVGVAMSALSLGLLFQFSISPFSQLLNLTSQNNRLLGWDLFRLLLISLALFVPSLLGFELPVALWAYSASQVVCYVVLLLLVANSLKRYQTEVDAGR